MKIVKNAYFIPLNFTATISGSAAVKLIVCRSISVVPLIMALWKLGLMGQAVRTEANPLSVQFQQNIPSAP